jgi:hypothetical protein
MRFGVLKFYFHSITEKLDLQTMLLTSLYYLFPVGLDALVDNNIDNKNENTEKGNISLKNWIETQNSLQAYSFIEDFSNIKDNFVIIGATIANKNLNGIILTNEIHDKTFNTDKYEDESFFKYVQQEILNKKIIIFS